MRLKHQDLEPKIAFMYVNIDKKSITKHILPMLKKRNLGRKPKTKLWRVVKAIIYRLKTGCQWRELPLASFFPKVKISWQSVYYHYNKWVKDGSWKAVWQFFLKENKKYLDMSSVQLDGSHTPSKRGGQKVGYQGRKKAKTTNILFLTDKQGIPLSMSKAIKGTQNDLFEIEKNLPKMLQELTKSEIDYKGLFLNADAGFDGKKMRAVCFTNDIFPNIYFNKRRSKTLIGNDLFISCLYKERYVVERTNAWIDAFKALLTRFETKSKNWESLHYLAFTLILLRFKTNHF